MLTMLRNMWTDRSLGWRAMWRRRRFERVHLNSSGTYNDKDWSHHAVIVNDGAMLDLRGCKIADLDLIRGSISFPRTATDNIESLVTHGLRNHDAARPPSRQADRP